MGYYVKYHELQNTYHHICNQINAWNSELENVKQKMLEVALMQEIKGETANSIRSYILEIHIPLINFLQQVLAEYKTRMLEYVNDYNQIDSNENAKIAIDRLDEQITNIHAGMDAFQAIEESVAQAIGMVAGLVSVSVPSGERITNNYEKLGNKASKLKDEVGECEYSHLTSDFSNIEDMLSNILKIINGQSGKSNVTITAYQAGSISKVPTFQKLQEAASTQNIDFDGSTKESEDIIAGYGTKSILDIMRYEFTKFVKENKLNNIKKKILDNLNQHISKYQYDDFSTSDGFISGEDILVDVLDFLLQSRKTFFLEYPELNINPITGMTVDDSKELYNSIKEILFKGYDNVVKLGANSKIPIISDYSRGLAGDTESGWNIYKLGGSFVKGGRQAAYDMVDGIIKTLIDPAETAEGIVNLLSLSKEDWLQIKDKAVEYFNKTVVNGTAEERAEFAGYAAFEVAMMLMTLSEIKSAKTAAGLADDVANSGKYSSFGDLMLPDEAARYDAYWSNVTKGVYEIPYGMTAEEYYQYLKGLDKVDSIIKGGRKTIITPEMEGKILMGQRKNPAKNELIGGHSPNINNIHPKYAIEEIATNLDGTKKVKFVTQYPDGNLSNIKTSTVFPDTWTNSEIIEGIKTVGNSPPIGVRTSDGATLYRGIVNGVQIEVIKVRDVVTSGYPTGGIKTGLLPGFNNYD